MRSHGVLIVTLAGCAGLVGLMQFTGDEVGAIATWPTAPVARPAPVEVTVPVLRNPSAMCTVAGRLALGDESADVACLEAHLAAEGLLARTAPDNVFDAETEVAVRQHQEAHGLVVDGVVGPQTAGSLGIWSGPDALPPSAERCTPTGRSAVVDRYNQRAWLCADGEITDVFPITSAWSQPDPGTYEVYAKDLNASSTLTGRYSTMTHFVAFTRGKYVGARIGFHSIPRDNDGDYVQPLDSVGTADLRGESSGCIRVLPDDAVKIWDFLEVGDTVVVAS